MKRFFAAAVFGATLTLTLLNPAPTSAQPVTLPTTWSEFDLQQQQSVSAGLLALTGQSSSGFTATVSSNGYVPPYPARSQYLPRVYAFFEPQPITNLGQRVTVSFDLTFKTVADTSNTGSFRLSFGDTNANNGLLGAINIGAGSPGTLNRYDISITQDTNWVNLENGFWQYIQPNPSDPNNLSLGSFCDGGGNMGSSFSGPMPPNGVTLGVDTTTVHHIRLSVERTRSSAGGPALQNSLVWGNSAGTEVFENAGAPLAGGNGDDSSGLVNITPWKSVNILGFCLFGTGGNQHFFGDEPGTYTISNLKVYSGFHITSLGRDSVTGDTTLKWESSRADVCQYEILRSSDLKTWTKLDTIPSGGYETSFTDTTGGGDPRFYQINKIFP